jgi:Bacterial Ig-like domain (group 1)/PKD domain
MLVLLATSACDRIALTAPTGSTVTLFSNLTVVPLGGTAEITATVIESGGTPVHDGTVVTFTTTIGTFDRNEGQTDDGKVKVLLRPGSQSGTAVVRAFSGGAQSGPLELIVGAAAVSNVVLTANPSSVSAVRGGTVNLSAFVVDEGNNPVPNVPVSFTTTAGTLSQTRVTTDANGEARTTLTTNRESQVRALVGATESNEVTITATNAPRISITPSPATIAEGQTVTFSYTITTDNNTAMRSVSIDFGDGERRDVGTQLQGTIPHTYREDGTFVVTITGTDINGEVGTGSTAVVVTPAPPLLVNVAVSPNPARVNMLTTITVTLSNAALAPNITSVTYDFGDGTPVISGSTSTTHVYTRVGDFTVRATVTLTDGRSATGSLRIVVQP